jgi:hypothetical protein
MDKEPIAVDDDYEIRDNQFWYNDCSFRDLIEGKNSIEVKITIKGKVIIKGPDNIEKLNDFKESIKNSQIFNHSKQGIDGRITLSYTIPDELKDGWKILKHQNVRVELLDVN